MKPAYVGVLIASLYIIFKMVLFFAGLQNTVLVNTPKLPLFIVPLLILVLLGVFYAINHYVRTSTTYDWMAAFKKGITVALVAGVISGIFVYIYYSAIDTDFLQLLQVEHYNVIKSQIPKEQIAESEKSLKAAYRPTTFAVVTVSAVNALGLISSVVVALLGRITVRKA